MKEFNERQAKVILEASSLIHSPPHKPKLYFIQGPPGTGKSHTIVGIVDAMFAVCSKLCIFEFFINCFKFC